VTHAATYAGQAARDVPGRLFRSAVFAALAVFLVLALRAKSDGAAPGVAVVGGSFVVLTALVSRLVTKERGLVAVFCGLLASQLALHVTYLFASTGQFAHSGSAGLFCSPAQQASGSCGPAERGGVLLLSVQLLMAVVFAWSMRRADAVVWQLARRGADRARALIGRIGTAIAAALRPLAVPRVPQLSAVAAPPRRLHSRDAAQPCTRRGPPSRRSGRSLPAPAAFARPKAAVALV
jgi:hypothetical protein